MPEFLGIEEHNGENKVSIDFRNARKFVPYKNEEGQIKVKAVPNPHKALMGENDLKEFIASAEQSGKDPSFYTKALKQLEAHNAAQTMTAGPEEKIIPAATIKPPAPESSF